MIITFLATTFVIALAVASIVVVIFTRPIDHILRHVVPAEISSAWTRYLQFAIYVVGIGGGVRVWALEKYLTQMDPYGEIVPLTSDRWLLEIYETIIGTLQSTAMVLLAFFIFALMAVVIVQVFTGRVGRTQTPDNTAHQHPA
jgi:hypothetical protein